MASEAKKQKISSEKDEIDDLPKECLEEIFKHLGVKTLVRCRLVS